MTVANYRCLRRRLRRSLRNGFSVEFIIRTELARVKEQARSVALAMLIAALRMPDEFHPRLNTCPDWIDVSRGLVKVNDVVFAVLPCDNRSFPCPRQFARHGTSRKWILIIQADSSDCEPGEGGNVDLAGFVGLSVLLRSGGVRKNILNWVALVKRP